MPSWTTAGDVATDDSRTGAEDTPAPLEELRGEVARLRKLLLKHGHAQELFHSRIEERIDRLGSGGRSGSPGPGPPQLRALIEFDQAVRHLLDLARGTAALGDDDAPRSLGEGLDLLAIREARAVRDGEPRPGDASAVDNYILRKARRLCSELPDGDRSRRLRTAADAYEAVLTAETPDPEEVDRVEDDLLELLEDVEEVFETRGP